MSRAIRFLNTLNPISDSASNAYALNSIEISEANFLFQVPNFGKSEITVSPTVYVRNLPWTFTIQLNEPEVDQGTDISLSVFVTCDYNMNSNWSCMADISFVLLSSNADKTFRRSFDHCFDRNECSKGCDQFISWRELVNTDNGYIDGNKIVFEVRMKCNEPKCVPWNSKRHTRFVGIIGNEMENSFLSSLVQILYTIEPFRTAVTCLSPNGDISKVVLDLRYIFQQLKVSDVPINIDPFIKSIGKIGYPRCDHTSKTNQSEYFFNFFLKLLKKFPTTKSIWDMFHGNISTLSTSNGQYEITKFRKLNGLKLKITNDANVQDLIRNYFTSNNVGSESDTSPPTLPNSRSASHWFCGLVRCGNNISHGSRTQIIELPSILILHLDRQLDSAHFIIEHRKQLKFGTTLDLGPFTNKQIDSSKYILHAVQARCDAFLAFINLNDGNGWLKFDNEIISLCSDKEAIDDNFRCVQMLVYLKCNEPRNKDDNAVLNCIICMEIRKSSVIFSTICGHVFCGPCIKKEIALRHKCPVCQNSLTEKDIHPIYI